MSILKPCPFCGMDNLDSEDSDTLHPTSKWRDDHGMRHYMPFHDEREAHGWAWKLSCVQHYGGCGAQVRGDSEQEAIDNWNRRAGSISQV